MSFKEGWLQAARHDMGSAIYRRPMGIAHHGNHRRVLDGAGEGALQGEPRLAGAVSRQPGLEVRAGCRHGEALSGGA